MFDVKQNTRNYRRKKRIIGLSTCPSALLCGWQRGKTEVRTHLCVRLCCWCFLGGWGSPTLHRIKGRRHVDIHRSSSSRSSACTLPYMCIAMMCGVKTRGKIDFNAPNYIMYKDERERECYSVRERDRDRGVRALVVWDCILWWYNIMSYVWRGGMRLVKHI